LPSFKHDAQFDFFGKRLAVGSSDGLVRIYNTAGDPKEHALISELSG